MFEFKLPSLGADMDEGKLVEWKVKPGDAVKRGDVLAIVDTSKAAVDVEIWSEGRVRELLVEPGETVPVGTVLATLLEPGETAQTVPPPAPRAARPEPPRAGRVRISPAARKRAEELGVDATALRGSGPGGAVALEDVEAAARGAPVDRATAMRRAIAAAMSRSKREIPHYYLADEVPLDKALGWLRTHNAGRPIGERMLPAVLLIKAVASACARYPDMNGFYRDGAFEPSAAVHAGIAIALRGGGLVAPAIHDAAEKTLPELMRELADLVQRARAGSLRSSEMSDPTITVTQLGDQGVDAVFGVIYPPQVALVGFGRIADRARVDQGELRALPCVTVSLAADHRVSDGHRGALFLAEIRARLQAPEHL